MITVVIEPTNFLQDNGMTGVVIDTETVKEASQKGRSPALA